MVVIIDVDVIGTVCSCGPTSFFVNKGNESVLAREMISAGIFKGVAFINGSEFR